jgi:hypothetical protein
MQIPFTLGESADPASPGVIFPVPAERVMDLTDKTDGQVLPSLLVCQSE